ncbi:cytochrome P450 [Sulfitobacter sp. KE29]|uniref:cytochrome P450 n=1 Tax=unclassified Sulfitobacter TaxID=196795 RepID=UPI0007C25CDA|nr:MULTISPECIES: cytochrome P450 [unclassified Sulfitobacter]KZY50715.1 cytochrome [Sulfitobacter sp. HI0054]MBO9437575.1 cytochrome P450 [Sulfitobacter sp. R18_2]MDF3417242.1 cytochrome P450 [Sulfitobacter sp. Ks38]MDF3424724.1 cytochrome P450 [Sulfitobacter sp. KE29]MDF3428304.1 cytochrome P450 [Sulfitobacter sp. S46]
MSHPPKPPARPDRVSLWRYAKLFRADILSAQPARLYRAWMAEFKTPFFRSYLMNQPELVKTVLKDRPEDFPKSDRIGEGLRPLLGNSVFLTNGETWKRQRRIIDPAFEGGRLRETFPAMWDAAEAAAARLDPKAGEVVEIEAETSHAAADVIFRTLFSLPIEHEVARAVFDEFRNYQRSQPILNLGALLPLPRWMPRLFRRDTRASAARIRTLITDLTRARMAQIEAGTAPDDLATKIMTQADPETGERFDTQEMVDQVAIFFLAGHETSASALAWALYLMATHPAWQERLAEEAQALETCDFAVMSKLKLSRDVFRETLRLYPPVPMMVRENRCPERFRDRQVKQGAQLVLSPWHLHRHERLWDNPDGFDPTRWQTENGKQCQRDAFIPFSAGPRVCTGAGFAMVEGPLILSRILRDFRVTAQPDRVPVPVAHLTVRSDKGIWLALSRR